MNFDSINQHWYVVCSVRYCMRNNSVALVRERTILTERPLLFGEVSANFCSSVTDAYDHILGFLD
jgi:hypothetical protein